MPEQQKKSRLESNCPPAMYECRSGECIYPKHLCDGEDDCQDGEDEKNCPDKPKPKKKKVTDNDIMYNTSGKSDNSRYIYLQSCMFP